MSDSAAEDRNASLFVPGPLKARIDATCPEGMHLYEYVEAAIEHYDDEAIYLDDEAAAALEAAVEATPESRDEIVAQALKNQGSGVDADVLARQLASELEQWGLDRADVEAWVRESTREAVEDIGPGV